MAESDPSDRQTHAVARQLRTLRAATHLQQRELAERSGISAAYLSQIETGKKQPSMEVLQRLATALDVTPSVLLADAPAVPAVGGVAPPARPPAPTAAEDVSTTRAPSPASDEATMRSREDLEQALRSRTAVSSIVADARHALDEDLRSRLGPWAAMADDCCRLLWAFAHGDYRAVPWDTLVLVTAALTYLAEPEDIAPEHHVDDMAVLAFTDSLVRPDLDSFREWERRR